jgi:hypothetical protein
MPTAATSGRGLPFLLSIPLLQEGTPQNETPDVFNSCLIAVNGGYRSGSCNPPQAAGLYAQYVAFENTRGISRLSSHTVNT